MITVGRKGRDLMVRYGRPVIAEFSDFPTGRRCWILRPSLVLPLTAF